MRQLVLFSLSFALLVQVADAKLQGPPPAKPNKAHQWLKQFAGKWSCDEPIKMNETAKILGGLWVVVEGKMAGATSPIATQFTLGYDTAKKLYVGTWIDTTTTHLWKYEGTLDPTGKVLTLEAEGPNPSVNKDKLYKFRDVHEFKSKDHRTVTSSMQGDDGQWRTFVIIHYHRAK